MAKMTVRERVLGYSTIGVLAGLSLYLNKDKLENYFQADPTETRIEQPRDVSETEPTDQVIETEPRLTYQVDREHLSPNIYQGRADNEVNRIVLHTTEGSGSGAESWLTNPQSNASAHYLIMEDGESIRLVRDEDRAWHVRGENNDTIGIEFAGYANQELNQRQIQEGAQLIRYLMQEYNLEEEDVHAHSELDPTRRTDPGQNNFNRILEEVRNR